MHLLACVCAYLISTNTAFAFQQKANDGISSGAASSISGTVSVAANPDQATNLSGVNVKLSGTNTGNASQTAVSDENGHFQFTTLPAGTYTLEISVEGFKAWSKTVALEQSQSAVANAQMEIAGVDEKIDVQGETLDISTNSAENTTTVTSQQLQTLPLAQQSFTEALPLNPGVVRTQDGKLNFNGQAENQGLLLVNSTENVDPATGSFSISVPIDVIQSMTVHTVPDTAEFGGFSGGLTAIETKPPYDSWNFRLHNLTPSFRGKNGHLEGVGMFEPRMVFGGPLVEGKVNFTEELTYEVNNLEVRGLAWPFNETKTRSITSFTQLQFILSSRHLLDVNVNVFPLRTQFADIRALVPQSASSDYGQIGASIGISDSYQFSPSTLLNTVIRYTRFDSHAHGQGPEDMQITPDGWAGNFFNSWSRNANEIEVRPAFQFANINWHGQHQLKIGLDASRRWFEGSTTSHTVEALRADGSLAEQINFQGGGLLSPASTEVGEFIEDHWTLNSHVALDVGTRFLTQSPGRRGALGPHLGVAYSPKRDGKTVFRAGAGTVYGHVPLLASSFLDNPTRVLSFYDTTGAIIGAPIPLQNVFLESNDDAGSLITTQFPRSSPRTFTWNVEVEREVSRNVSVKVNFMDSQTRNLFVVDPIIAPPIGAGSGNSLLALANTGAARYRRLEANVHAKPFARGDLNVSYIWSRSRGDLNSLSDTFMPFEQPIFQPNFSGILRSDVPNRVVTWGQFELPFKLTLTPVVNIRNGLPYSDVDDLQNYVGVPNSLRYPIYFSFDARIYREFPLRLPFKESSSKRKIRFGVYSINITNRHNPVDVYNDVTSPFFGQFAGFDRRVDGLVIDVVE
ncbi:MAG TPA: carboxypeptidase regulatory-like domain-containing protein [Candidatus Saccharimonadales bacterium]|nr:carboxypeptidase regulatory-like domain-containing protein [Candidatus Saccharimonadales bacterium]